MRRSSLLLLFPVVWVACFSNGSAGGGGPQFDASASDAEFDGTTPDVDMTEASPLEAAADATPEAAPPVEASVDVNEAGPMPIGVVVGGALGYEVGVNVVWSDAAGNVVGTAVTNASGSASTLLSGVSMATVLLGTNLNSAPFTVMDLAPGDVAQVVDVGSVARLPSRSPSVTSIPAMPTFEAGVGNYAFSSGACRTYSAATPLTMFLSSGTGLPCVGLAPMGSSFGAVLPALVEADDATGAPLGFTFSSAVTLSPVDDAGLVDIALGGSWSTTMTSQVLSFTNLPDGGQNPLVAYSEIADGILTPLTSHVPPADAGLWSTLVYTHPGFATGGVQAEMIWPSSSGGASAGVAIADRTAAPTQDGTLVLDATPVATAPTFTNATTAVGSTVAQPKAIWTLVSGDLSGATALIAQINWYGPVDGGTQNGNWTIVSKGTSGTALTPPMLPATLASYAPSTGSFTGLNEIFAVYGQTAVPTYTLLVPLGSLFTVQPCSLQAPVVPALPGMGTAMVVSYAPGSGC